MSDELEVKILYLLIIILMGLFVVIWVEDYDD